MSADLYLACRVGGMRHAWEDHDGSGFRRPQFGIAIHYVCTRCGTIRRDIVNRFNGELLQRRYYHPEGYALSRDEKPSIEHIRLAMAKRQKQALKARKRLAEIGRRHDTGT